MFLPNEWSILPSRQTACLIPLFYRCPDGPLPGSPRTSPDTSACSHPAAAKVLSVTAQRGTNITYVLVPLIEGTSIKDLNLVHTPRLLCERTRISPAIQFYKVAKELHISHM